MTAITCNFQEIFNTREKIIYQFLCSNLTNKQIADQVGLSVNGVSWNLQNIYRKLGVMANSPREYQVARRQAIMLAGANVQQAMSGETREGYSIGEIRAAAKRVGLSCGEISDLVSFLEMD